MKTKCYNLYERFAQFIVAIVAVVDRMHDAKNGVTWCSTFFLLLLSPPPRFSLSLSTFFFLRISPFIAFYFAFLSSPLSFDTNNLRRRNGFYQQLTCIHTILIYTHTHTRACTRFIHRQLLPNKLFSLVFRSTTVFDLEKSSKTHTNTRTHSAYTMRNSRK